jgi:hypothetical protein
VPKANINERNALVRPVPSGPNAFRISFIASTIKITETSAAKISSVNLVKYFIRALASVKAQIKSKIPDHIPTQA